MKKIGRHLENDGQKHLQKVFRNHTVYRVLFEHVTMCLFHLCAPIVNRPQPEFYHVTRLQLAGAGHPQIVNKNFGIQIHRVAPVVFVALQYAAERAVHCIGKFPFGDVLVVGIGVGGADLNEELERVAGRLSARLVIVEPAHIEAVEAERVRVALAAGGEQNSGQQKNKGGRFHTLNFGTNVRAGVMRRKGHREV